METLQNLELYPGLSGVRIGPAGSLVADTTSAQRALKPSVQEQARWKDLELLHIHQGANIGRPIGRPRSAGTEPPEDRSPLDLAKRSLLRIAQVSGAAAIGRRDAKVWNQ